MISGHAGMMGALAAVVILGFLYLEAPFAAYAATFILSLGVLQWHATFAASTFFVLWGILIFGILCFGIPFLRRRVFSKFIFQRVKNELPSMSSTEREAIEAGDVWWEGDLFCGRPHWEDILQLPKPALTQEETLFLNQQVEHLCEMINDWAVSHLTLDLTAEAWKYLKQERFFGMIIPKKYGGLGFSALAHATVVQKLATHSLTAAITTMVPNSLGPAELLINYGTEAQKEYYLPRLALGEEIPCFMLTSPVAGSDASAITDIGIVSEGEFEGKKMLGIKLSWDKRYITLAPIATVFGLAFKLYDPNKLLGNKEALGITLCLIPATHPGVERGKRHFPMDQAFMNGPTRGTDVFVPLDWVIGGRNMIGKGWQMIVERLSVGRGISLPALSAASVKQSYRTTGAYAAIRKQFHAPIGHFEGVEAVLAKIAGFTYLSEATQLFTLTALDKEVRPSVVTAMTKYHLTEIARIVVNHAMDVHGGKAIMQGPKNYLSNSYQSLPISITVEGANILTRSLIIFGQGAIRCHPYLQEEMKAMQDPDQKEGLKRFDKVFFKHAAYTVSNAVRVVVHSFTAGLFSAKTGTKISRRYCQQLSRMSIVLAFVADVSLILLGGKLKRCERLSGRLGDVLSHLYMASAILKYEQDFATKKEDALHIEWCMKYCLYQIQAAFFKLFKNFPIPVWGRVFRFLTFPYGRAYHAPSDCLEHRLASIMLQPSKFRDRLTQYCYLSNSQTNPINQLEFALQQITFTEPLQARVEEAIKKGRIPKTMDLHRRLNNAVNEHVITEEEANLIQNAEEARRVVIQVDEFTEMELVGKQTV